MSAIRTVKPTTSRSLSKLAPLYWIQNNKILTLVTLAVVLDWVPSYILGEETGVSATRFIALPLIALDAFRNPRRYFASVYGWVFTFSLLIGLSLGVMAGNIPLSRMISLLSSIAVFLFYLQPRSWGEIGGILRILFVGSFCVPLVIILAWQGLFEPTSYVVRTNFTRVIAGVNWSSLGLYMTIAPAAIGGLLLLSNKSQTKATFWGIAVIVIIVNLVATLVTAQRTASIAFAVSLGASLFLFLFRTGSIKWRNIALVVVVGGLLIVSFYVIAPSEIGSSMSYRLQNIDEGGGGGAATYRLSQYSFFVHELMTAPAIVPSGVQYFALQMENVPHFIIGEAYYDGGLIFAAVLLVGILMAAWTLFRTWRVEKSSNIRDNLTVLSSLLLGFMVQLSWHPGLNSRIVYLVIGLAIAIRYSPISEKNSLKPMGLQPSTARRTDVFARR